MLRSELIEKLSIQNPDVSLPDIENFVGHFFEEIIGHLVAGGRVEVRGFGAFSVRVRTERMGLNPKTGAAIKLLRKALPYFKASTQLANRVDHKIIT